MKILLQGIFTASQVCNAVLGVETEAIKSFIYFQRDNKETQVIDIQ